MLRGVVDVEFHPNLNLISSATKSEPSGNMVSHSSSNAYNAIPFKGFTFDTIIF